MKTHGNTCTYMREMTGGKTMSTVVRVGGGQGGNDNAQRRRSWCVWLCSYMIVHGTCMRCQVTIAN
jgi:hypothetical protein